MPSGWVNIRMVSGENGGLDVDVGHGEVLAVEAALQLRAEEMAGGAVAAVGADEPPDASGLLRVAGTQRDLDAVGVLGHRGQLDAPLHDDPEVGGAVGQHRLGVGLRDVQDVGVPGRRPGVASIREPGGAGAPVQHREAGHPAAAGLQPGQHAQRGEHLHAARVHPHRAGFGGGPFEGLDDAHAHPEAGQLAGGREADRSGPTTSTVSVMISS